MQAIVSHLGSRFFTACDGSLAHLDRPSFKRTNYAKHHQAIRTVADFKATLRAGPYAWPGGYPLFFLTSDGAALSFESARREAHLIISAIRDKRNDGWRVVACDINYEDGDLVCEHSGKRIESAYAD